MLQGFQYIFRCLIWFSTLYAAILLVILKYYMFQWFLIFIYLVGLAETIEI